MSVSSDMKINPPSILQPVFTTANPFPDLPTIRSASIEQQVFTHRSYYARPNHVFEDQPDDPSPDNEKYEHLGDTVLNLIVTQLLHEHYPRLRVGPSTKLRSLMVGNPTLADISRRYGLHYRLRLHPAQVITLRTSMNVQADVFESYIGGLYLDQGLSAVEAWLRALFMPYTKEAYNRVRNQYGLPISPQNNESTQVEDLTSSSKPNACDAAADAAEGAGITATDETPNETGTTIDATPIVVLAVAASTAVPPHAPAMVASLSHHPPPSRVHTTSGHLALFNQLLQRERLAVEWMYRNDVGDETHTTPIWIATVVVNGELYGTGRGGTKKSARNEAAKEGLVKLGFVDV